MKIRKILNNNTVIATDESNEEIIVVSLGLGFRKQKGDVFSKEEAQKIFVLQDKEIKGQYKQLLKDVEPVSSEIAEDVISYAVEQFDMRLNDIIHITLTDHINGVIKRIREGVNLTNQLTMEISRIYDKEFQIGLYAIGLLKEKTGLNPLRDEAAFVALNFVNSQEDGIGTEMEAKTALRFISDIILLVEKHFHMDINVDSLSYYRFAMHLKFLCKRIYDNNVYQDDAMLYETVLKSYPEAAKCVDKIVHIIHLNYKKEISTEEKAYLIIYVEKLLRDSKRK